MIDEKLISIRPMMESDTPILERILNEPEVQLYYPMSNSKEVSDALRVWNFYMRQGSVFTIEVGKQPAGLAVVYVSSYEKLKRQALFAIVIGKEYRGQGLGSKLLAHIIDKAKNEFGIKLLHLEMYEGNPAKSLYERFGFKHYATHERFLKEANGTYKAKIMMELKL